jgi:hypothetical protein
MAVFSYDIGRPFALFVNVASMSYFFYIYHQFFAFDFENNPIVADPVGIIPAKISHQGFGLKGIERQIIESLHEAVK